MNERRSEIARGLSGVEDRIASAVGRTGQNRDEITLIAVTKNFPISDVEILRELGVENFGENRDSEGESKSSEVAGIWHFQGQIQSNKIKSIAHWADVVHSIDNAKHIKRFAAEIPATKILSVFLQVCLDSRPGRGGAVPGELGDLAELVLEQPQMCLLGLMAVAPLDQPPQKAFSDLRQIHLDFQCKFPLAVKLSAGMSGDFESAIEYGATHIRVGSSILGLRSP